MATITLNQWAKFRIALSRINEIAGQEFRDYFLKRPGGLAGVTVNEVAEYAYLLATKYGEASAELACQMYELIAKLEGVTIPAAEPSATPTKQEVYAAINATMKKSSNIDYISAAVERMVKQTGQDTTIKNAIRDRAEFAWVPAGDTCSFCLALASRGWQEATRKALKGGHAEHIHGNCDCAYATRFKRSTEIGGYDPDKYYEEYNSYNGSSKDKINAMRRAAYEQNKDKINAQKRAAYAARKAAQEGNEAPE